jgi:hypothetical protein
MHTGLYIFPCPSKVELMQKYKSKCKILMFLQIRIEGSFEWCTWFSVRSVLYAKMELNAITVFANSFTHFFVHNIRLTAKTSAPLERT